MHRRPPAFPFVESREGANAIANVTSFVSVSDHRSPLLHCLADEAGAARGCSVDSMQETRVRPDLAPTMKSAPWVRKRVSSDESLDVVSFVVVIPAEQSSVRVELKLGIKIRHFRARVLQLEIERTFDVLTPGSNEASWVDTIGTPRVL